jgi:hypothetical protein
MGMDASIAKLIPAGAVLRDAYWAVPTSYTTGDRFDSHGDALADAIERKREAVRRHAERDSSELGVPLPERITVDLRWSMEWEPDADNPSSGLDFVAHRFEYDDIAAAQDALDRLVKVAVIAAGVKARA